MSLAFWIMPSEVCNAIWLELNKNPKHLLKKKNKLKDKEPSDSFPNKSIKSLIQYIYRIWVSLEILLLYAVSIIILLNPKYKQVRWSVIQTLYNLPVYQGWRRYWKGRCCYYTAITIHYQVFMKESNVNVNLTSKRETLHAVFSWSRFLLLWRHRNQLSIGKYLLSWKNTDLNKHESYFAVCDFN